MIRTRPILCIYHTWGLLLSGSPVEVAEARLQDAVDADPEGSFAGEVLAIRALIATYQRKMRLSAELSRRALQQLPEDRLFFRSFIAGYLGYGALYGGDLVAARQPLEEAVRISQRAGNLMNAVLALCHLGELAVLEAHAKEARAFYEQALTLAADDQGQRQPIAGLALIGLGGLELLQYNLQAAARYLVAGIDLIQRWGKAGAISGYVALARVKRVQGDLEGAHEAIQTAERLAIQFDAMLADDAYVAAQKARLWLAQGEIEAVSVWLEEHGPKGEVRLEVQEHEGDGTVPFNRLLLYTLAVRVHLAEDRPDRALQVLRPLLKKVEAAGWSLNVIRLLILESLALYHRGDISEALVPLARALSLSEPEGFAALYLEEGAPMVELLRHAASRGISPGQASDLLAQFETKLGAVPPSPHSPAPTAQAQPLVEPLTERELDVLRLLATSLSTAEIADRLFVTVSTVRSHNKNIYAKLNVHRRFEAAERARVLKLI
jgi:LuxR family maltose regulon positive regulatory protein